MKKKILFLSLVLIFSFLSVGAGCKKPWATTGKLDIKSGPSGAEIFIDGQDKNVVTPYTFDLKAGNYNLKLTKEDFKDYEEKVTTKRGETTNVEAELELLNPNIHKEVYKQAQEKVAFPVVYPTYLPEGFELEGSEDNPNISPSTQLDELGSVVTTYIKGSNVIRVHEGVGDVGRVTALGEISLNYGTGQLWGSGDYLGIICKDYTDYMYGVSGKSVPKEELIKVANSIIWTE